MNERMKIARKKLGYTQVEIAKLLGYTQPTYSGLESGKYKLNERHIKNFCRIFGISELWLTEGKGEMLCGQETINKFNELFDALPDYCKEYVIANMKRMIKEFPSDTKTNNSSFNDNNK